jgi:hypothetical protein
MEVADLIRLHQYYPTQMMPLTSTVLVVGQRGSGKSTMLQYLLHCVALKLDVLHVFCPTRDTCQEYEAMIPGCNVYTHFDTGALQSIIDTQKRLVERRLPGESLPPRVGVVLDDCVFAKKPHATIRYLMIDGRHHNFFFMVGASYVLDIPRDLLFFADIVMAFPEANAEYREPLRRNLLGAVFQTDEQLHRIFTDGLRVQEALVFDSRAHREKRPHLFFCKAVELPATGRHDAAFLLRPESETFTENTVTETKTAVTFHSPVHIDLQNVNKEDGSVTMFATEDVLGSFIRLGKSGILSRLPACPFPMTATGLKFAYKTVAGPVGLSWTGSMLHAISIVSTA